MGKPNIGNLFKLDYPSLTMKYQQGMKSNPSTRKETKINKLNETKGAMKL